MHAAQEVFDNPIDADPSKEFLADPRHHIAVAIDHRFHHVPYESARVAPDFSSSQLAVVGFRADRFRGARNENDSSFKSGYDWPLT